MSHLGMPPIFGARRDGPVDEPAAELNQEASWRGSLILAAAVMTAFFFSVLGLGEDASPRAGDQLSNPLHPAASDVRYHSAR